MKKLVLIALLLFIPSTLLAQPVAQGVPTYAEDSQHVSGQKGLLPFCRRADTPSNSAGTNNDYGTFNCSPDGGQYVTISSMIPSGNAVFAPLDVTLYSGIGAAYASAVDFPDGTKVIVMDNQTNGDVMVSVDGGVSDTFHIKAGDVFSFNLASAGVVTTADLQIKDGTSASTAGSFYVYSYK